MKSELNVFKDYPYSKRYYLTHPWVWFKHTFDNFRAAWQRATKGYCNGDVWDVDHHWLRIMPAMLNELAEKGIGYPGIEPFDTPEKWKAWLHVIGKRLEALQDDWAETCNEYEKAYFKAIDEYHTWSYPHPNITTTSTYTDEDIKELHDKWLNRVNELNELQREETIAVFTELAEHLYQLWT